MGLEQLCQEITATAQARASAMVKEATEQAAAALAQAKSEGQKSVVAAKEEGDAFGQAEMAERVEAARMEGQKELSAAREEAADRALEQVWERYRTQSQRPGYAKSMRRWAEMAVAELDTRDYVLRARSEDLKLLSEAGFKVSKEPIVCCGGVKAETAGGKICVDYTLESLFENRKEEAYKEVYARLFSDEEGQALQERPAKEGAGASAKAGPAARSRMGSPKAGAKVRPSSRTKNTSGSRAMGKAAKKSIRGRR